MAISDTNSIAFAGRRMNNRRWNHFVGGRLTGTFDSAVGITTSYTYKPNTNDKAFATNGAVTLTDEVANYLVDEAQKFLQEKRNGDVASASFHLNYRV